MAISVIGGRDALNKTARYGAPMMASEELASNVVQGRDGNVPHVAYRRMQQHNGPSVAFHYTLANIRW
jgi:hypothetical protein